MTGQKRTAFKITANSIAKVGGLGERRGACCCCCCFNHLDPASSPFHSPSQRLAPPPPHIFPSRPPSPPPFTGALQVRGRRRRRLRSGGRRGGAVGPGCGARRRVGRQRTGAALSSDLLLGIKPSACFNSNIILCVRTGCLAMHLPRACAWCSAALLSLPCAGTTWGAAVVHDAQPTAVAASTPPASSCSVRRRGLATAPARGCTPWRSCGWITLSTPTVSDCGLHICRVTHANGPNLPTHRFSQ